MSDSHGLVENVRAGVRILRQKGAEVLFHCGDVGGLDVLDELLEVPTYFVWGNTDRPSAAAYAYCESAGLPQPESPMSIELAGKRIVIASTTSTARPALCM